MGVEVEMTMVCKQVGEGYKPLALVFGNIFIIITILIVFGFAIFFSRKLQFFLIKESSHVGISSDDHFSFNDICAIHRRDFGILRSGHNENWNTKKTAQSLVHSEPPTSLHDIRSQVRTNNPECWWCTATGK